MSYSNSGLSVRKRREGPKGEKKVVDTEKVADIQGIAPSRLIDLFIFALNLTHSYVIY